MVKPDKVTIYYFNGLDSTEKLNLTYFNGIFLSKRNVFGYITEIYSVGNFFVELWYGGLGAEENPFVKIKSFRSIKFLEPYLCIESSFKMLKDVNY